MDSHEIHNKKAADNFDLYNNIWHVLFVILEWPSSAPVWRWNGARISTHPADSIVNSAHKQ